MNEPGTGNQVKDKTKQSTREASPGLVHCKSKGFNVAERNKTEKEELPLSASYIVNQKGEIIYAFLETDYKKRRRTQREKRVNFVYHRRQVFQTIKDAVKCINESEIS